MDYSNQAPHNTHRTPSYGSTQGSHHGSSRGRIRRNLVAAIGGTTLGLMVIAGLTKPFNIQFNMPYSMDGIEPAMAAASSNHDTETLADKDGIKDIKSLTSNSKDVCSADNPDQMNCLMVSRKNSCSIGSGELCDADLEAARIAWKYFENNYNPETGLVNAVNNYPSTTMWDTGSALAAYVAALDFGFIDQKEFDDAMMALFETLSTIELFDDAAPNKVYHTKTKQMVDYANKPAEKGIGVSVLDLARLVSWMNTLQCMQPKYGNSAKSVLSRWDYSRLIKNEEMYGMARDKKDDTIVRSLQEGRLGYEQYAGKIFERVGFSVKTAASYENKYRADTDILGVSIAYDNRDPKEFYANNYVVTESYAMDAMELGIDDENRDLLRRIFEVQKKRWQETGIVTAISEDNIDRKPYFLYNTIFNAGKEFDTTNSSGTDYSHLKAISTKAAISMAILFPEDEYSQVLMSTISSAYDPEGGWYSGIYESGLGYNDIATANTNGVIMTGMLYKKYGALFDHCEKCAGIVDIDSELIDRSEKLVECTDCDE